MDDEAVKADERERLLDRRNRLMNSYGWGSFRDGQTDAEICQIDERLSALSH